jgi:hypothetical protein
VADLLVRAVECEPDDDRAEKQTEASDGVLLLVSERNERIWCRVAVVERSRRIDVFELASLSTAENPVFPEHGDGECRQRQFVDQIEGSSRLIHAVRIRLRTLGTSTRIAGEPVI